MNIIINGEKIDFTLEKEKTAGEVMNGLTTWLDDSSLLVGGISIDGNQVIIADDVWRTLPVGSIVDLEIEAIDIREGRIRQLETARDYFVLMNNAAKEKDIESIKELSDGFPDLLRILPHLLGETSSPVFSPGLEKKLGDAGFPLDSNELDHTILTSESERTAMLLEVRRRETSDPLAEARGSAAALVAISDKLDDVAVNLQTGKDKLAMDTIIFLTELLQALIRSIAWINGNDEYESVIDDLTGILAELESALTVSDTVLIGDLLEYEIKPRLQELPERLGFTEEAAK